MLVRMPVLCAVAIVVLIAIRVAVAGWVIEATRSVPERQAEADVAHYHGLATAPGTPYRDFPVEWPPLGYAAIELLDGGSPRDTTPRLVWAMLGLDLATFLLMCTGWSLHVGLAYLVLALPLVMIIYLRLDLLATTLGVAALVLARKGRDRSSGALLGAAALTKVWPAVLIGVLVVEKRWKALWWTVGILSMALALWMTAAGPRAPIQVLTVRGSTGWEVSSVVGSISRLFSSSPPTYNEGAFRIGHAPFAAKVVLLVLMIGIVAMTSVVARRAAWTSAFPVTIVSAVVVFMPQLMPQYAFWLVPWAAVAVRRRVIALITLAICSLSFVAYLETAAVARGAVTAQAVVLLRNALLVALPVVGVMELRRQTRRTEHAEPTGP